MGKKFKPGQIYRLALGLEFVHKVDISDIELRTMDKYELYPSFLNKALADLAITSDMFVLVSDIFCE